MIGVLEKSRTSLLSVLILLLCACFASDMTRYAVELIETEYKGVVSKYEYVIAAEIR